MPQYPNKMDESSRYVFSVDDCSEFTFQKGPALSPDLMEDSSLEGVTTADV
jgi:hypothetical protein